MCSRRLRSAIYTFAIYAFGSACVVPATCHSEDWPQWMGPGRDNRWQAENVLTKFPEDGLKEVWSTPVAWGYSGPAVAKGKVFVMDYVTEADLIDSNFGRKSFQGTERILCLDEKSGEQLWKHEYPLEITVSYPSGPRCTPLVEGDLVYTLGAEGNLIALNIDSGKVIWQRNLKAEYNTNSALWGYAAHPVIYDDKLLSLVGGEGSHTVAFDKMTGKEIWRYGTASEQGYSPPKVIEASGTKQLILCSPDWIASVDPSTGKEFWTQPYTASNGSLIMTPIHYKDHLFIGGYSKRNLLLELGKDQPTATKIFKDKTKSGISPVNVQPFQEDDFMIGLHESGEMMAIDIATGKRHWVSRELWGGSQQTGTAFIYKNGDLFYLFCETGELVIANIDKQGFQEIDRVQVIEPTNKAFGRDVAWYPPAFANGRMYVRNDQKCICVEMTNGK